MAKADFELTVSLEAILHKAMNEFAMKYYQEHGVMIDCVNFGWHKTIGGDNYIFQVNVETSSNG